MYYCNSDKEPENLSYKDVTRLIKVCDHYDDLSRIKYTELIKETKHLDFFKYIDKYKPKDIGTIIRWLYRGLSLQQAINKIEYQLKTAYSFSRYNYYNRGWVDTFSPYQNRNIINEKTKNEKTN